MKKLISKTVILILCMCFIFSLVACSEKEVPHEHNFIEESNTPATCTEVGEIVKKCSCGEERKTQIPIVAHKYVEVSRIPATCTDTGSIAKECLQCGNSVSEFLKKLGHNYKESVKVSATCTDSGIKTMQCTRCNDIYDENINPIGHSYDSDGNCTRCKEFMYNIDFASNLKSVPVILDWYVSSGTGPKLWHRFEMTEMALIILEKTGSICLKYSGKKTYDYFGNTSKDGGKYTLILKDAVTGEIVCSKELWTPRIIVGQSCKDEIVGIVHPSELDANRRYILYIS